MADRKRKHLTEDDISKLLDEFDAEDGEISSSESPSSDSKIADDDSSDESSDDDIMLPRDWTTIGRERIPFTFCSNTGVQSINQSIGLNRIGGSGRVGEGGTTMVSVTNRHWGTQLPPGNHGREDIRIWIGRDSGR